MSQTDFYSDAEVDDLCAGLRQPAAMVRYLRGLGLRVDRKPNGRPLVWRAPAGQQPAGAGAEHPAEAARGINVVGLQQWAQRRQGGAARGKKAQGR